MRFHMRGIYAAGGNEKVIFNVPCDGYFANLTVKLASSSDANHIWSFGNINQDNFFLQVTAGTPSVSQGNSKDFWSGATVKDSAGSITDIVTTVWNRNKALICKRHTQYGFSIDSADSVTTVFTVEGDYVPYNGAEFSYTINFDGVDSAEAWNGANLLIPQSLSNAYIDIKGIYTDTQASEGLMWLRLTRDSNYDISTFTTDESGIVGSEPSNDESFATGNQKGIYLSVPADGLTDKIQDIMVPHKQRIYAGNMLQFEFRDTGGAEAPGAGQIHLTLTVMGLAKQSNRRALKGNYYSGRSVLSANMHNGGSY